MNEYVVLGSMNNQNFLNILYQGPFIMISSTVSFGLIGLSLI